MNYTLWGRATSPAFERFAGDLAEALGQAGFSPAGGDDEPDLVINLVDASDPKPYRRGARGTFVAAIHELPEVPADVLQTNYPMLVRALANIVLRPEPGRVVHDHGARPLRRRGH